MPFGFNIYYGPHTTITTTPVGGGWWYWVPFAYWSGW